MTQGQNLLRHCAHKKVKFFVDRQTSIYYLHRVKFTILQNNAGVSEHDLYTKLRNKDPIHPRYPIQKHLEIVENALVYMRVSLSTKQFR